MWTQPPPSHLTHPGRSRERHQTKYCGRRQLAHPAAVSWWLDVWNWVLRASGSQSPVYGKGLGEIGYRRASADMEEQDDPDTGGHDMS